MEIEAVVTDLDGSLWARDMSLHPATQDALAEIERQNRALLVATGRRGQSALAGLQAAGLTATPVILMNGAQGRDQVAGPSFFVETINSDAAAQIVDLFADYAMQPLLYVDDPDHDLLYGDAPSAGMEYIAAAPGAKQTAALTNAVEDEPVIGFGVFGFDRDVVEPIAARINTEELATAIITPSIFEGGWGIMIQAHGIDKRSGIEAWCARTGHSPDKLAAIGDGLNDLGMLAAAKIALVPSNASPEALELATHVIDPNEEGGWSQIPGLIGL